MTEDATARAESRDTELPVATRLQQVSALFLVSTASVPSQLPWPVAGKSVKDIYLGFAPSEDAVKSIGKCAGSDHYPQHLAVDIATAAGTEVRPIASGRFIRYASDTDARWGKAAIISHDNGAWSSVTWHLDPKTTLLKANSAVTTNTVLGKTLALDPALGDRNHVHLGIRVPFADTAKGYDCGGTLSFIDPLTKLKHRDFVLIDDDSTLNGSNASVAFTRTWTASTFVTLYHGRGYRVSNDAAATVAFTAKFPSSGTYDVYVRVSPDANRTSKAEYTFTSGSMTPYRVTLNQQTAQAGHWIWLTAFSNLSGGGSMTVTVRNTAGVPRRGCGALREALDRMHRRR